MKQTPIKELKIPSSTNAAKVYKVAQYSDGTYSCNCPRWVFKKGNERNCPHIITMQAIYKNDAISEQIEDSAQELPSVRTIKRLEDFLK